MRDSKPALLLAERQGARQERHRFDLRGLPVATLESADPQGSSARARQGLCARAPRLADAAEAALRSRKSLFRAPRSSTRLGTSLGPPGTPVAATPDQLCGGVAERCPFARWRATRYNGRHERGRLFDQCFTCQRRLRFGSLFFLGSLGAGQFCLQRVMRPRD